MSRRQQQPPNSMEKTSKIQIASIPIPSSSASASASTTTFPDSHERSNGDVVPIDTSSDEDDYEDDYEHDDFIGDDYYLDTNQNSNLVKEDVSYYNDSLEVDDDDDAIGDEEFHGPPDLEDTDVIFQPGRWGNPLIVEKYKLVFFTIPKVACTEWKLLFRRILGFSPDWDPEISMQLLHDPSYNGLTYLSNYTKEAAQEMLTSEDWTRAVFVREPKERILSAFLDKMVVNSSFFKNKCCNEKRMGLSDPKARDYCKSRKNAEDFPYFLKRTLDCPNPHWDSQANAIDRKWWKMMNFVGYMDNVADDAQRLLQSIKSRDGKTAWNQHGKTGWGESGKSAFMVRDTAHHATNAHDKLRKYYTKCEEVFVEKHWASEWEQEAYHFDKIRLFDGKDLSGCGDVLD